MIKPFFVTGLPRSRTAWAANWLTTDKSLCLHDPPAGSALAAVRQPNVPWNVGCSGPELVTEFDAIQAKYPAAPWVVLTRSADEALGAFLAVMKRQGHDARLSEAQVREFWKRRVHQLAMITRKANVRVWNYLDLDDEHCARTIWQQLLPEIDFNRERWTLLCGLNVTQNLTRAAA